jgi:hypothetical protein
MFSSQGSGVRCVGDEQERSEYLVLWDAIDDGLIFVLLDLVEYTAAFLVGKRQTVADLRLQHRTIR